MRTIITLVLLIGVTALSFDATPAENTHPYHLTAQDTQAVAKLACESKYGVKHNKLDAWTTSPNDKDHVTARIECATHQRGAEYSVQHAATCKREANWQCDSEQLVIRTKLGKRQMSIYATDQDADTAYTLVKKLAAYRNRNGDPVLSADTSTCSVAQGPFKEMVDVTCNDRLYRLSYFCPQSSCPRIYAVGGMYIPPNEGGL